MIIPSSYYKRRSRSYRTGSNSVRIGRQCGEFGKRRGRRGYECYISKGGSLKESLRRGGKRKRRKDGEYIRERRRSKGMGGR